MANLSTYHKIDYTLEITTHTKKNKHLKHSTDMNKKITQIEKNMEANKQIRYHLNFKNIL